MTRGVNKVILIGNLGDEPLFRTTNSGSGVANFSLVTNEVRRNAETGMNTEIPEWHRIVIWGKLAEIAHQYLHKGSQVYIEGRLRTRSYTDKQEIKRYVTEIVADEMQMLGSRNNGIQRSGDQQGGYAQGDQSYGNYGGNSRYGSSSRYGNSGNSVSPYGNASQQQYSNSYAQNRQSQESSNPKEPVAFDDSKSSTTSAVDGNTMDDDIPF